HTSQDRPRHPGRGQGDDDMNALSRRAFGLGAAGLVIAFSTRSHAQATTAEPRLPGDLQTNRRLESWLKIGADGTVTVQTGKVELGQGATTALAQMAAEELDVELARVRMVPCDTSRSPNEGFTAGSNSIEGSGLALRSAAAEARAILLARAAA